ncbi:MAG TPA: carboxymuconolactone decarboxylase family protein [Myxococcota bacterium]|nr:carboxymuconolactone decarboxylase family protein [Myxococcota bacterium]
MKARIDVQKVGAKRMQAMGALQAHVDESGLDERLLDLVRMRASQLNGCAYCLDMHSKDARAAGETEQRLYGLDAWREAPYYSDRERAALEWTEAVTLVADGHVCDEVFAGAREHFSEEELADLTLALIAINGWNRLCISFRVPAGGYQPGTRARMMGEARATH